MEQQEQKPVTKAESFKILVVLTLCELLVLIPILGLGFGWWK